jgi:hypothetical protein
MSAATQENPQAEPDRLDAAADQAIAACGGDMRSAIRALILANEFLELELSDTRSKLSLGYGRGKQPARPLPQDRKDWYD